MCNYLPLLTDTIEAVYHFWPTDELCESSVFVFGFSTISLLINNTLPLINQLVSITKQQWYGDNVTPRIVVVGSLILFWFLSLFVNSVYVFGVERIRCAYQTFHVGITIVVIWFILFTSSAVIAVLIYLKTKPVLLKQDEAVAIDNEQG